MSRGLCWRASWAPPRIRKLVDSGRYPVSFVIPGNQHDINGNAPSYDRMTQRSKHVDPADQRYKAWKFYVIQCWSLQTRQGLPCETDSRYRLDVKCFFVGARHADP